MTVLDHEGFWSKLQTNRLRSMANAGFPEARTFFRILVSAIMLALVGGALFLITVSGQQANQVIEIDPNARTENPYVGRFTQRPAEIRLQIKGDETNYQWVRVASTDDLKIKAIGELEGYEKEESIQLERWYQFKKLLPLNVTVGQGKEETYQLKLEFGRLKAGAISPADPSAARAYGETDKVELQRGLVKYIQLVDDSRPIVKLDRTSLIMERPRDANSGPPKETLQLSTIDPTGSKPTWVFVKFKNRDIDLAVDKDTDKEKSTAAPGEQLQSGRFFGFTGSLKLVLTRHDFVNDDPITLSLQGGRGVREPGTRNDAIDAVKKPDDQIAVKGPELKVEIATVKPTAPGSMNYWMIIIISAGAVAVLVTLLLIRKRRAKATATGAAPVSDLFGGVQGAPSTGAGSVYDRLTDTEPAHRNIAIVRQPQLGWFGKLFSFIGRSKVEGETDEELEERKRKQRQYADAEAGRLATEAARMNPPIPGQRKESIPGAPEPTVPNPLVGAQRPKEVEPISQEMLDQAVAKGAETSREKLRLLKEHVDLIEQLMNGLQDSFNNHRSNIQKQLDTQKASIAEQSRTASAELESKLDAKAKEYEDAIQRARVEFDKRLNNIESDSQASRAEQDKRDGSYAALLSSILERSVDELQGDRLSSTVREAADALNRFFQSEIPRSEVLDDLASRAERIRSSLKSVVDRAGAFNSQAEIEIAGPLQKATNLVAELSLMQAQLRSRQLAIEARVGLPVPAIADLSGATPYDPKLQIPISAHSKARYTFIEELGFAIKREMDKFRDPAGYFRRELEKLVTSDVVSVADICDSKTKNSELEQSLQVLFSEARLRSILPKPKEQFDPTEQTIIQIISGGGPADSHRIVKVVSRGFYYNDGEKDRLLRKAGVEVYR